MAQIFDSIKTTNTVEFAKMLETRLRSEHRIKITQPSAPDKIRKDEPLLVMCQNYSRIAADIQYATGDIAGIAADMVAVIIIHAKEEHALPRLKTEDIIEDENCKKFGLLVDFGYLNGTFHDCELNKRGERVLHQFLDKRNVKRMPLPLDSSARPVAARQTSRSEQGFVGVLAKYPIQFYTQPCIDVKQHLMIPKEFQVVQSVADLTKHNLWIVVCYADSVEDRHVHAGESQNAKILVLLDLNIHTDYSKMEESNMLEIRLKACNPEIPLQKIQADVMEFIQTFIAMDVTGIFNEKSSRIEVYTECSTIELEACLGNLPCIVRSVTDFTKQDPRILWLIVCENNPSLIEAFEQASPENAKVILVLHDEDALEEGYTPVNKQCLLILKMHRGTLLSQQIKIKEDVQSFMKTVQMKLMNEPLKKLFLKEQTQAKKLSCQIL